jgi:hypothetical protein
MPCVSDNVSSSLLMQQEAASHGHLKVCTVRRDGVSASEVPHHPPYPHRSMNFQCLSEAESLRYSMIGSAYFVTTIDGTNRRVASQELSREISSSVPSR